jgi:hypothetical protein
MISVLDTPVAANGLGGFFCTERRGADEKAGFLASVPHPVFGALEECHSGHADDVRDEPVPAGLFKRRSGIENLYNAGLGAHALYFVGGFMARQRRFCLGDRLDFSQQAGLIFLNLNKQMAFRLAGCPESFFDSAWRPG